MLNIIDYKPNMDITEPCIVRNMPDKVYRSFPAISYSNIKDILKSPAHFKFKKDKEQTKAMRIGTAVHCLILEGEKTFNQSYEILDSSEYKTKDGRPAQNAAMTTQGKADIAAAEAKGKKVLFTTDEDYKTVMNIWAAWQKKEILLAGEYHPVSILFQNGISEASLFWEENGIKLKARVDYLPFDLKNIPDLKTSQSADPLEFRNQYIRLKYYVQGAMYRRGIEAITGCVVNSFYNVVIETDQPECISVIRPDNSIYNFGDMAIDKALDIFKTCQQNKRWSGYCQDKVITMTFESEEIQNDLENGIVTFPRYIENELSLIGA